MKSRLFGTSDALSTKEKILAYTWNPNKASKGEWREYFGPECCLIVIFIE